MRGAGRSPGRSRRPTTRAGCASTSHRTPRCPSRAWRCCSAARTRWCSCRAPRRPRRCCTCGPSGSTPGRSPTRTPSRACTTRTSRRCARATTRSPRSGTRRPRAAAGPGTTGWTCSTPRCWPASGPTDSRSPRRWRLPPTARAAWCASRTCRWASRSSPDRPACTSPAAAPGSPATSSTAPTAGRCCRTRSSTPDMGLTVAVTGPTGEIGKPFVRALDRAREVERIVGMARRPFDPAAHGWKKVTYRKGDVLDRASVQALCEGADVVVHLAFIIVAGSSESDHINLEGSRNVFEAAVAAGAQRLMYASSVAAYGFPELDRPIVEDDPAAGNENMPYSHHKAQVEALLDDVLDDAETDAYIFRPCIVAGPEAPLLVNQIPYVRWGDRLPGAVGSLFDVVPVLKPVIPDPGVPFQLVHHDDVASALVAGVLGRGEPGTYNLAGPGEMHVKDLADATGYSSVPIPEPLVGAAAEVVSRVPFLPEEASWIEAVRVPV